MKSLVRSALADMVRGIGLTHLLRFGRRRTLAVLCYHRVLPEADRARLPLPGLAVTPETLVWQLNTCRRWYECLPLREAVERIRDRRRSGARPLLSVTFDDGYADNFEFARPVLDSCGVRATFFPISGLVGGTEVPWYDRLARAVQGGWGIPQGDPIFRKPTPTDFSFDDAATQWLFGRSNGSACSSGATSCAQPGASPRAREGQVGDPPVDGERREEISPAKVVRAAKRLTPVFRAKIIDRVSDLWGEKLAVVEEADRIMSREQVIQLSQEGHEVASHTRNHPLLTQLDDDALTEELRGSRRQIEEIIGSPVKSLAYPNGDHDDRVVRSAINAGYRWAVTMEPGINTRSADPHRLRRIYVEEGRFQRMDGRACPALFELELTGAAETLFLRGIRRGVGA